MEGLDPEDVDIRTLPETIARTRRDALPVPRSCRRAVEASGGLGRPGVALPLRVRSLLRKHWALRFLAPYSGQS